MHLSALTLRQFRNYSQIDLSFSPRLNVFVGPNGSGKSNLMEAVAVLAAGQSHRGADSKHIIQWEKDGFLAKGRFEGEEAFSLEIRQPRGRARQTFLDNAAQKRLRDWVGRVPIVSFSPDDLHLVKGEPAARRRVLNAVLCQVDHDYLDTLQRYNKVLAERNAALRQVQDGEEPVGILDAWDASLLKEGASLALARRALLELFDPLVRDQHLRLSSGKERVQIAYKPSFVLPEAAPDAVVAANRKRLQELREGEIALGSTLIGPHRDELEFSLNGNPARAFASQGQQRTLALAVKLAELSFLTDRLRRRPVCLLDDMLSELDAGRRENLVASMTEGSQCLVSLATLTDWPESRSVLGGGASLFDVREGAVSPRAAA